MSQFDRGLRRVTALGLGALFVLLGPGPALAALVKDVYSGVKSSSPEHLVHLGSLLLFVADNDTTGSELWRSDGTTAGTVLVKDINPGAAGSGPQRLRLSGGSVFFSADDGVNGRELWITDGTAAGTLMVED